MLMAASTFVPISEFKVRELAVNTKNAAWHEYNTTWSEFEEELRCRCHYC